MDPKEALLLDNQLCFTIYACSRAMTNLYRPWFDRLGLTYPQYLVLLILWEEDGVTVKDIGERLFLDSGTLTPLLKRMEAAKLIKRNRSIEDERRVHIFLTESGQAMQEQACLIPMEMMRERGLSSEEIRGLLTDFKHLLGKLHHALDK